MRALSVRRLCQLLFVGLFVVIFLANRYPYSGKVPADLFLRASPLLPLAGLLETGTLCVAYWPGLVVLAATVVLGRFFCGWVCPLGACLDAGRALLTGGSAPRHEPWMDRWRSFSLALLAGLAILAVLGIGIWSFLDPLSLFHRTLTGALFPLASWALSTVLGPLGSTPLSSASAGARKWLMPEGVNLFVGVWPIAWTFVAILLLELAAPRFWCRFVCPAGAWLSVVGRWAPFRRTVTSTCTTCLACRRACPMGAIPAQAPTHTHLEACTLCMLCLEDCPTAVGATTWSFGQGSRAPAAGPSRREFLGSIAGSIVTLGLIRVSLADRDRVDRLLRPPGAVPEELFRDRCIRCLACVRVCRSNGACLQAGEFHQDFRELWLPEARMRVGYCEYNCNLCGRVCPTGVINTVPLDRKQKMVMGMAYFDRDRCIPYCRHESCMVCEEHCPVPDKAIRFEVKEAVLPDGRRRIVKYPYVVRELCIGCGICEYKCPLVGQAAVFVVNECAVRPLPPRINGAGAG
ncbi:MAG: 4Fe-4S binding protein [Candidatus Riflebacteria bacterium]|nr:4Fe-4S binding protein [Candidatus Riflebacteria bacterium]